MEELIRDRYEPLEVVGRGGQGEIVKALDRLHDRTVALKVRPTKGPEERDALLAEARTLLSLKPHSSVALAREDFFIGDHYYLVMDWVEGTNLQDLLQSRGDPGLPYRMVTRFLDQIAEALDHLHSHDPPIIHRDVKPANIILTREDKVVLVDFGLSSSYGVNNQTRMGTPGYSAPELIYGVMPTPAADVYGLAATAFALLTGSPPKGERPTWEGVPAEATKVVERSITRALSTDPDRRTANATEFVNQLKATQDTLPSGTITFLLTDIEGSTRLWDQDEPTMQAAVSRHQKIISDIIGIHSGKQPKAQGEGDSVLGVFARASDAVAATLEIQRQLHSEPWPTSTPIRVRVALHTGEAELREGDYYGTAVNRCARLRAIGHGGQALLSRATAELVRDQLPRGATLEDLGIHRLRDLAMPEQVFQLHHPDLPAAFPPLRSIEARPNNLPIQITSFIGRDREIDQIKEVLANSQLVTLTGVGGVGKTRLALQVAADLIEDFRDGVWLVDLSPVADPSLVSESLASALGLREEAITPERMQVQTNHTRRMSTINQKLLDYLTPRQLLLLFDNCEHLIAEIAEIANDVLRRCDLVTILCTSREPLGVTGEAVMRVPSLSIPDKSRKPKERDVVRSEAVNLFSERANLIRRGFKVNSDNAGAVVDICQQLDGIPLAIELAAARMGTLSAHQIAERLDDRFRLLTGGGRTALERQRTLRAAIDWSFELLSGAERVLLRRVAVFVGGFTLEAAEAVCSGGPVSKVDILDLLSQLTSKSLVEQEESGLGVRFRLLETIRQYASEKLAESDEAQQVRISHRDFFSMFAFPRETHEEWLTRLEADHDNLHAALRFSLNAKHAEEAHRLVAAIWEFWEVRGHLTEGRRWTEAVLSLEVDVSSYLRAQVLGGAATMAFFQGDFRRARPLFERAISLSRDEGYEPFLALLLRSFGRMMMTEGDHRGARESLQRAVEISRRLDQTAALALSLHALGELSLVEGDYPTAKQLLSESQRVAADSGGSNFYLLGTLGRVLAAEDDYTGAQSAFEEQLVVCRKLGDRAGTAWNSKELADLAWLKGDYELARGLAQECLTTLLDLADRPGIATTLNLLGTIGYQQGDFVRARAFLEESLAIRESTGEQLGIATSKHWLGLVNLQEGRLEDARELMEQDLAILRSSDAKGHLASSLNSLGYLRLTSGDLSAAQEALEEALEASQRLESKRWIATSLKNLGSLHRSLGELERSSKAFHESLELNSSMGLKAGVAESLEGMAGLAVQTGKKESAATLFGAAEALRDAIGAPLPPMERTIYEQDVDSLRNQLAAQDFASRWAVGREIPLQNAVESALEFSRAVAP